MLLLLGFFLCILLFVPLVDAHVPYLELKDLTTDQPFQVRKSIRQSIAVYAWLRTDGVHPCDDVDVFQFRVRVPVEVYLEVLVPVVDGRYVNFSPWYALVGPGLSTSNCSLPFDVPAGYGAVVKQNVHPGDPRGTLYEPFGGKWYYTGPVFQQVVEQPGVYYVYFWDPFMQGGDYVAVLGNKEIWGVRDIMRAFIVTPLIRHNRELHIQ